MLRYLVKDSAVYGGADLFAKLLAFFAFPVIAAVLSPVDFGTLELVMTTTALLGLAMNCGLNNAVARFYWDIETRQPERPVIVSSGLAAHVLFGLCAWVAGGIIVWIIMPFVKQAAMPITWVGLVSALALMVLSQWLQFLLDVTRLHFGSWRFFSLSLLVKALGLGLGAGAVVWLGWGVDGLLAIQALAALLTLPLALFLVRQDITVRICQRWFRKLVHFGYPFIFAGLAHWLFASMDRWMLAAMSSVEEVGIYSVAFRFATAVFFVSDAFGRAWSPFCIKIRTDAPGTYRETYARVLLLLLFVMLVVGGGLALFSDELIGALMPDKYRASAAPLAVLSFGIVLQSTQQVTAVGISLEQKTYLFVRLAWLAVAVNFVLNALWIPLYGAQGAAWATLFSYLTLTGGYAFYTQKLHHLPIQWHKIALMLALGSAVLLVSLVENNALISWKMISFKVLLAAFCLVLTWRTLLIKEFNSFRHV
jgi:O-antigen/teichoic acid export membrane protein